MISGISRGVVAILAWALANGAEVANTANTANFANSANSAKFANTANYANTANTANFATSTNTANSGTLEGAKSKEATPTFDLNRGDLDQDDQLATNLPPFSDDGDRETLLAALHRQDDYLQRLGNKVIPFGGRILSAAQLRRTHQQFEFLVRDSWGSPDFDRLLRERFELIWAGPTHMTAYYLPRLEASRTPNLRFKYPLHARPASPSVGPYPTHAQIADGNVLAGKGLELAWVGDEFERYLLMIQGSGTLIFQDGTQSFVNFAGKNNRAYTSLGKLLIADGKIATQSVSIPAIRKYFAEYPAQQHGYLIRNESYIFFRLQPEGPYGVDGVQLTGGRSIATDKRYWPSGGIAYIRYPRVNKWRNGLPDTWEESGRFVCDQDTGGAIRGKGRLDLFTGAGEEAALIAGTLNATGSLIYLVIR